MTNKRLKLAISPCPNDTFIFGPMILDLMEAAAGLELETDYLDIEKLNVAAMTGKYDVIKVSAALIPHVIEHYQILSCGGALGENCGPLLVSSKWTKSQISKDWSVLIPGKQTTANYLLQFSFPELTIKTECLFSKIEDELLDGRHDAGLIIHESRFSYAIKGLKLIADLGELWSKKTNCPIPLGVILIKRSLAGEFKFSFKNQLSRSLERAYEQPGELMAFITSHATDLHPDVINQHVRLYVNEYSKSLGPIGFNALNTLFKLQTGIELQENLDII